MLKNQNRNTIRPQSGRRTFKTYNHAFPESVSNIYVKYSNSRKTIP